MSEPQREAGSRKREAFPLREEQPTAERSPHKRRSFKERSMVQLTLVRFREFIREPEAVFWTFVFPILLAAGLGIAFRQRGPDKIQVGVIASAPGGYRISARFRASPCDSASARSRPGRG